MIDHVIDHIISHHVWFVNKLSLLAAILNMDLLSDGAGATEPETG